MIREVVIDMYAMKRAVKCSVRSRKSGMCTGGSMMRVGKGFAKSRFISNIQHTTENTNTFEFSHFLIINQVIEKSYLATQFNKSS